MTPRPTDTTPFQEELYAALMPWADEDANNNWDLLIFCGAIASMFDQIETYARDTQDDTLGEIPGWALIFIPDFAPPETLDYAGQFVGIVPRPSQTEVQKRENIKQSPRRRRGHPDYIVGAVRQYLTDPINATVILKERDGSANHITILTYDVDTPAENIPLIEQALEEAVPDGNQWEYFHVPGTLYILIRATYVDYAAVESTFLTYDGLRNNEPGT